MKFKSFRIFESENHELMGTLADFIKFQHKTYDKHNDTSFFKGDSQQSSQDYIERNEKMEMIVSKTLKATSEEILLLSFEDSPEFIQQFFPESCYVSTKGLDLIKTSSRVNIWKFDDENPPELFLEKIGVPPIDSCYTVDEDSSTPLLMISVPVLVDWLIEKSKLKEAIEYVSFLKIASGCKNLSPEAARIVKNRSTSKKYGL